MRKNNCFLATSLMNKNICVKWSYQRCAILTERTVLIHGRQSRHFFGEKERIYSQWDSTHEHYIHVCLYKHGKMTVNGKIGPQHGESALTAITGSECHDPPFRANEEWEQIHSFQSRPIFHKGIGVQKSKSKVTTVVSLVRNLLLVYYVYHVLLTLAD